jgi:hypothetical protein
MNVTELIELTNQLSTDDSEITLKERGLYLKYLNMANVELYQTAATGLRTIIKKVDLFLDAASDTFILPNDLFVIRQIMVNKVKLSIGDIENDGSLGSKAYLVYGNNIYCDLTSNGINFISKVDPADNIVKRYITLFYAPNPLTLVENVNDPLIEIDTPIYPKPYHHFLVHGALYYLYFSNQVFLEKMAYIKDIWDKDKIELAKYKNYGL